VGLRQDDAPSAAQLAALVASRIEEQTVAPFLRGMAEVLTPAMASPPRRAADGGFDKLACECIEAMGFVVAAGTSSGVLLPVECRQVVQLAACALGESPDDRHVSVIRMCHTICAELEAVALTLLDFEAMLPAVIRYASLRDGSEIALKSGEGAHTSDLEARLAALQALAVFTVGGHSAFSACTEALLSNIGGTTGTMHPNVEVRREAVLGLHSWWQWVAQRIILENFASSAAFISAVVDAIACIVGNADEDVSVTLEAACLAQTMLTCEAVSQHQVIHTRLVTIAGDSY